MTTPTSIRLPNGQTLVAASAAIRPPANCSVGLFCGGEGAELHLDDSVVNGICCCCRAGTRDHD